MDTKLIIARFIDFQDEHKSQVDSLTGSVASVERMVMLYDCKIQHSMKRLVGGLGGEVVRERSPAGDPAVVSRSEAKGAETGTFGGSFGGHLRTLMMASLGTLGKQRRSQ